MFCIVVEMWAMSADDEFDLEYCGEFLWSSGFSVGEKLLFENATDALIHMSTHRLEDKIPGFEYRYRISEYEKYLERD
jgi:hypothetical protein